MSDELHKYPGNMKHYKVDEATATHLRIIADQAELIQQLVDALHHSIPRTPMQKWRDAIEAAASAGFKPSDQ